MGPNGGGGDDGQGGQGILIGSNGNSNQFGQLVGGGGGNNNYPGGGAGGIMIYNQNRNNGQQIGSGSNGNNPDDDVTGQQIRINIKRKQNDIEIEGQNNNQGPDNDRGGVKIGGSESKLVIRNQAQFNLLRDNQDQQIISSGRRPGPDSDPNAQLIKIQAEKELTEQKLMFINNLTGQNGLQMINAQEMLINVANGQSERLQLQLQDQNMRIKLQVNELLSQDLSKELTKQIFYSLNVNNTNQESLNQQIDQKQQQIIALKDESQQIGEKIIKKVVQPYKMKKGYRYRQVLQVFQDLQKNIEQSIDIQINQTNNQQEKQALEEVKQIVIEQPIAENEVPQRRQLTQQELTYIRKGATDQAVLLDSYNHQIGRTDLNLLTGQQNQQIGMQNEDDDILQGRIQRGGPRYQEDDYRGLVQYIVSNPRNNGILAFRGVNGDFTERALNIAISEIEFDYRLLPLYFQMIKKQQNQHDYSIEIFQRK